MKSIHDPEYQKLIDDLIKARKLADITQQELADTLEKPQSFVAKYENCERRLDILEYQRIMKVLSGSS